MKSSTFVVIPAYNEEQVILNTLKPLIESPYQVVVVDDGSKDNTFSIIKQLPVYSIRHFCNLGSGAAIQTGTSLALKYGAKIIVHFDADGQHNPDEIQEMIKPILQDHTDIVIGSRFLRRSDAQLVPLAKRILLKGAVIINGIFTGIWLSDAHNGFVAMSDKAAKTIYFTENRYAYLSELLIQIRRLKLRYQERPTKITYSEYSISKGQSPWNALNILIDVILKRIFK